MKKYSPIIAILMMGCTAQPQLSAQEELIVSTLSGSVEVFNEDVLGSDENAPESERPGFLQECETEIFFNDLFDSYDVDMSARLEIEESERVHERRKSRGGEQSKKLRKLMDLLLWVYDLDADGELSEEERQDLFTDFSERCDVLQEKLLEEFDLDEDGVLSEDELAAIEDEKREKTAEHEASKGDKECKKEKSSSEYLEKEDIGLPPFAKAYDEDQNGELNDAEFEVFRAEYRELIRSGVPFGPKKEKKH
ncbi:MAG: hypothetical protein CMK59_06060 [Proteobacteria bacterium]|nr:hypothetical protein [Pseudomonadota bacterium]